MVLAKLYFFWTAPQVIQTFRQVISKTSKKYVQPDPFSTSRPCGMVPELLHLDLGDGNTNQGATQRRLFTSAPQRYSEGLDPSLTGTEPVQNRFIQWTLCHKADINVRKEWETAALVTMLNENNSWLSKFVQKKKKKKRNRLHHHVTTFPYIFFFTKTKKPITLQSFVSFPVV